MIWRKSSKCANTECIKVRANRGRVQITTDGIDPMWISASRDEWEAFLAGAKAGDFDNLGEES